MIDLSLVSDGGIGWLDGSGPESHLVLSTRVRLARNLAGRAFPGRAPDADRAEVLEEVRAAARQTGSLGQASLIRLDRLPRMDRQFLHERHLVSKELAAPGARFPPRPGAAVMLQGPLGAMVNEEDHLRLQGLVSGLDLGAAWAAVGTLDAELGQRLAFAFHPEFGYLTQLPNQRRNRAAGIGPDPPAGAGPDQGDQQGPAEPGAGRPDVSGPLRGGERGGRQLLPVVEPDHAGQVRARAARSPRPDGPAGHRVRGAGPAGAAARRAGRHRGQGVARLRPAAVRAGPLVRGGDEPA